MRPFHLIAALIVLGLEIAVLVRAMLRPHREPAARLAWVILIVVAPIVGAALYLLLGETRLRRRRVGRAIDEHLPRPPADEEAEAKLRSSAHYAPFALARTVNRLEPSGGNSATATSDSNAAIDSMVADVDAAKSTVHVCTYIWLDDTNGLKMKEALIRAAGRGVAVRALADALGSRRFVDSSHWRDMRATGVEARIALPIGNPVRALLRGRLDLRNHRKSLIVDNRIAWCGSQNLADPEFRIKPRFAPWVDLMTRWEGPIARQWQFLFVSDWMAEGGEDLSSCICDSAGERDRPGTIIAQAIGTGPTMPYDAMPSCFAELIHSAREELVVTTPYFVPDEQLLYAFLSAARRGVRTILVFPKRNDSRFVSAASRSYYDDLVEAGAQVHDFRPGLLHAKTMIVDRKIGLIGSANLDRRSFELNFENNILFADEGLAAEIRDLQDRFIAQSDPVTDAEVERFTIVQRLAQNFCGMMSPIL
ncbi:MAG TPA: cardiolipin synthase [Sphingomicrobium sp.]|nr:cardiolipin synthase [Sphingomicrobium sp.]